MAQVAESLHIGFIGIPSPGVQENIPLGKKQIVDIVVQTEDQKPEMKLTKSTTVQTKKQELQMKLTKEMVVQTEEQEPKMKLSKDREPDVKLTKEVVVQIEGEEEKDKLVPCIPSYKGKLIPFHLNENLIRDLSKTWEEYINKVEGEHKNTVAKLQRKVKKMENDKKQQGQIMDGVLSCSAPSTNYNVFLTEILLMFKKNAIINNKPFQVKYKHGFIEAYRACMNLKKDLLYELYQHNFLVSLNKKKNPNPDVGDVQLRAFVSYLRNQASWVEDLKNFKRSSESILWVRGEYEIPVEVIKEQQ